MKVEEYFSASAAEAGKISAYLGRIPEEYCPSRVLQAWEAGRLLSPGWMGGGLTRSWLNVVAHQAATGVLAHAIASWLVVQLDREGFSVAEVVIATLVHDVYKRLESETVEQAKLLGRDVVAANREAEIASGKFLTDLGFSEVVAKLASATGALGLDRILAEGNIGLGAEIVFYADCCVSGDAIVGYKKRFDDLLPEFQSGGRYHPWGNEECQRKYGMSHREIWDRVVLPLEKKLAELLGVPDPGDIYKLAL